MGTPGRSSIRKRSGAQVALANAGDVLRAVLAALRKDLLTLVLVVASIAIVITFFVMLNGLSPQRDVREVPLSTVSRLAADEQVRSAILLDNDHQVVVTTIDGRTGFASYPRSDAATQTLLRSLQASGASVTVDLQPGKPLRQVVVQFLLPIVLLVCLFALFTRLGSGGQGGGIAAFSAFSGRGKKGKKGGGSGLSFDQVAGVPEALAELREIRDYLADPAKYDELGATAPKGVLLVGPPGTGKTLLARATAGEADAAFFSASGAEFVEALVGIGAARIRDLFAKARRAAPAIIFIDELDAAGRKRGAGVGQGNDEREQTLNQLLVEMDGFGGDAGVVVMAASNRPDILDPALLRPGRFDRQITVDTPDVHGRTEILSLHARGRPLDPDVDLAAIARMTPGFSGAELANVVNEAALLSVRGGNGTVDQHTLEEAIDRVVAGPAKKHILTEDEQWLIAVHEAGHAVVARALGQRTSVQKLSIVARGRQLGTSAHMLADRDAAFQLRTDLERQLAVVLSGVAAEIVAFGQEATTAADDLHAATRLARSMITTYGMSDLLGHVTIGDAGGEVFLGAALADLGSIGPQTLNDIDAETERLVDEAERRAEAVLRANWDAAHELARSLLERETLSGVALEALLGGVQEMELHALELPPSRREARADGRPDGPAR